LSRSAYEKNRRKASSSAIEIEGSRFAALRGTHFKRTGPDRPRVGAPRHQSPPIGALNLYADFRAERRARCDFQVLGNVPKN